MPTGPRCTIVAKWELVLFNSDIDTSFKTRSVGPRPKGRLREHDPQGGIPSFGERSFTVGPKGMVVSIHMDEGRRRRNQPCPPGLGEGSFLSYL